MTSISYETQHGATNGPASADCFISKFSGTEGIEQANLLDKHMRITLGKINALHFLYTSLEDLSLNLRKVLEKDPSLLYRSEENYAKNGAQHIGPFALSSSQEARQISSFNKNATLL